MGKGPQDICDLKYMFTWDITSFNVPPMLSKVDIRPVHRRKTLFLCGGGQTNVQNSHLEEHVRIVSQAFWFVPCTAIGI